MSNTYVLVNPFIHGEFEHTVKAKNSVEAGKIFYKGLSEHFNNAVPKFYFTIQKGDSGNGKYSHFKVNFLESGLDLRPKHQSVGGHDVHLLKKATMVFTVPNIYNLKCLPLLQ